MPQTQRISRNNTTIAHRPNGGYAVTLHSTVIVKFDGANVTLNTGGWNTATTRNRMNQVANQFHNGSWRVSMSKGKPSLRTKAGVFQFDRTVTFDINTGLVQNTNTGA